VSLLLLFAILGKNLYVLFLIFCLMSMRFNSLASVISGCLILFSFVSSFLAVSLVWVNSVIYAHRSGCGVNVEVVGKYVSSSGLVVRVGVENFHVSDVRIVGVWVNGCNATINGFDYVVVPSFSVRVFDVIVDGCGGDSGSVVVELLFRVEGLSGTFRVSASG